MARGIAACRGVVLLLAPVLATAGARTQTSTRPVPPQPPLVRKVNAPVAPEAIYIGTRGGVSVIDLNGFGQGTGDIRKLSDPRYPFGYKRNPNLGQPGVYPALTLGVSNADAGSLGALTLTRDTALGTKLINVAKVTDMALGQPLDLIYNNENINRHVSSINQVNPATGMLTRGNTIAVAPHPNPPRLVFPIPNPIVGIEAEEPTVTSAGPVKDRITVRSPPCIGGPLNKLVRGDPFSRSAARIGIFGTNFGGVFYGPQPPSPRAPMPFCPYTSRQQIGHFLYVLDEPNERVLVVNSNRFTILRVITLPSPASMAMAPHLKLLAVSNAAHGTVSFIDTDPLSRSFHRVLGTIKVGRGPAGLAWQPEGEALLVSNRAGGTVTIISGATFRIVKTLKATIRQPIDVAVSSRQFRLGWRTWTWFAYILNGDGSLSVYESGPKPIGPDAVRATGLRFPGARAIQPGPGVNPCCWITHRDPGGLGQVSKVELRVSRTRVRSWRVTRRIGGRNSTTPVKDLFSGNDVIDLAFDEIINLGAHREYRSAALPSLPAARHSGKSLARHAKNGDIVSSYDPRFLFVALADTGTVDVIVLDTGHRLRTLAAEGVTSLAHYWRQ